MKREIQADYSQTFLLLPGLEDWFGADEGEHGLPPLDRAWNRECPDPMVADVHCSQSQEAVSVLDGRPISVRPITPGPKIVVSCRQIRA